jgi:hypothetical protein
LRQMLHARFTFGQVLLIPRMVQFY